MKVGPKAEGKFKVGDRVGALLFQQQCHKCFNCEMFNDIRFCKNCELKGLKNNGKVVARDCEVRTNNSIGGMAEYMSSDAEQTFLLPDSLPFEQAAPLMCAGVCEVPSGKI